MAKHQGPFADCNHPPFQNGAGFLALDLPYWDHIAWDQPGGVIFKSPRWL